MEWASDQYMYYEAVQPPLSIPHCPKLVEEELRWYFFSYTADRHTTFQQYAVHITQSRGAVMSQKCVRYSGRLGSTNTISRNWMFVMPLLSHIARTLTTFPYDYHLVMQLHVFFPWSLRPVRKKLPPLRKSVVNLLWSIEFWVHISFLWRFQNLFRYAGHIVAVKDSDRFQLSY